MRFFLVSTLSLFLLTSMVAQDLVVTRGGDSINCKIDQVEGELMYYSFTDDSGIKLKTVIPMDQVHSHERRYYSNRQKDIRKGIHWYVLSLDLIGGYSRRVGELDPDLPYPTYHKELLNGWNMGIDASVFFAYNSGISFKYNRFTASNSMENALLARVGGQPYFGDLSDHIAITFAGPGYVFRQMSADQAHVFTSRAAIGYLMYNNEGEFGDEITIVGNTWAVALDAGYHYQFSENVGLGLQASFMGASLTEMDVEFGGKTETIELEEGKYESLHRVDLTLKLVLLF